MTLWDGLATGADSRVIVVRISSLVIRKLTHISAGRDKQAQ